MLSGSLAYNWRRKGRRRSLLLKLIRCSSVKAQESWRLIKFQTFVTSGRRVKNVFEMGQASGDFCFGRIIYELRQYVWSVFWWKLFELCHFSRFPSFISLETIWSTSSSWQFIFSTYYFLSSFHFAFTWLGPTLNSSTLLWAIVNRFRLLCRT